MHCVRNCPILKDDKTKNDSREKVLVLSLHTPGLFFNALKDYTDDSKDHNLSKNEIV